MTTNEGGAMVTLVEEFMRRAQGVPDKAAADFARSLMTDDDAALKRGYSRENALIAALEVFPQADREAVALLIDGDAA